MKNDDEFPIGEAFDDSAFQDIKNELEKIIEKQKVQE